VKKQGKKIYVVCLGEKNLECGDSDPRPERRTWTFFFWITPAIRWEGKSVDRQIDLWTQAGHGLTRRLGKLYGDE